MDHHAWTLASQEDLPLDGLTPDWLIEPTTHKRNAIKEIGRALLATDPLANAQLFETIGGCSTSVTSYQGGAIFHNRCNHRLCSLCAHLKEKRKLARLLSAIPHMGLNLIDDPSPDGERAIAVKLSLNAGKSHGVELLKGCVRALHDSVRRLKDSRRIRPYLIGFHRVTEVTVGRSEHNETTGHPHAHITFVMRLDGSTSESEMVAHVRSAVDDLWPRIVNRALRKHGLSASVNTKHMSIEGLRSQTRDDLQGWFAYCHKGAVPDLAKSLAKSGLALEEKAVIWQSVSDALRG